MGRRRWPEALAGLTPIPALASHPGSLPERSLRPRWVYWSAALRSGAQAWRLPWPMWSCTPWSCAAHPCRRPPVPIGAVNRRGSAQQGCGWCRAELADREGGVCSEPPAAAGRPAGGERCGKERGRPCPTPAFAFSLQRSGSRAKCRRQMPTSRCVCWATRGGAGRLLVRAPTVMPVGQLSRLPQRLGLTLWTALCAA